MCFNQYFDTPTFSQCSQRHGVRDYFIIQYKYSKAMPLSTIAYTLTLIVSVQ